MRVLDRPWRCCLVAMALLLSCIVARAAGSQLAGDGLRAAVTGATVHLDTPLGTVIPLVFAVDGTVSGSASGFVAWHLGAKTDSGRWWIAKDRLCHHWQTWFKAKPRCMVIRLDGAKFAWSSDDGDEGTGTVVQRPVIATAPAPLPPSSALGGAAIADPRPGTTPAIVAAPGRSAAVTSPSPELPKSSLSSSSRPPPVNQPPQVAAPTIKPKSELPKADTSISMPPRASNLTYRVAFVRTGDVLNIRSGPSSEAEIIGHIPPAGRGIRLGGQCDGEWCAVAYGAVAGWVNRFYLFPDLSHAERMEPGTASPR